MDDELRDNDSEKALWARAALMFLFYIIFNILEVVIGCIALLQLALVIFTNTPNENLTKLGQSLGAYLAQMVEYMTFATEDRPYPFGPWPKA